MGKRLITSLFLLLPISIFAQSKAARADHIKQLVTAINTDKTLTKIVLDNEYLANLRPDGEMPDNGQEITGYFRGDTLVKIVNWLGISYCIKISEIYLDNGKPVFVFAMQNNYHYNNKTHTMDYTPLKNVFEGRYYFDGSNLIQTIVKGNSITPTQEVLNGLKADMRQYPKLLFKELKKRKLR